jgi:peptidase S41-like protein
MNTDCNLQSDTRKLLIIIGLALALTISASSYSQTQHNTADLPLSINACFGDDTNVVIILPTGEKTKEACDRIGKYAKAVFKNRGPLFLEDTAALKEDLSRYTIITYGTLSGNLWVRQNLKGLPVAITKDKIVTDREFAGTNLRFITLWFNPANPVKPWIIYTAQDEKDVAGINGVFHGSAQFHVAMGTDLLQSGYYSRKSGAWMVSKLPDFRFPALTRKQMYEDYDRLTSIVEQVIPLMEVNRQIYGVDIRKLLSDNRSRIRQISQTEQFVDLINRTIAACRGSHFWIASPEKSDYYKGFVDDEAYKLADQYYSYCMLVNRGNNIDLPLLYFKGSYYTLYDVVRNGITYRKGMKVLTCNGKTPDEIVRALTQSGISLSWDYDLRKYYTTQFYNYSPLARSNSLVAMKLEQMDGTTMNLELNVDAKVTCRRPQSDHEALVALVNSNILYINLPIMDPKVVGFYKKELLKYKDRPIQKVVVDIRNNGGGSDETWTGLLSLLLKKEMVYYERLGVKKSDINHQYLARHSFGKAMNASGRTEKISFLNNEEFQVLEDSDRISPDANSLKLDCKIFVLSDNIYSSAGTFMNICKNNGQLVSVGIPNSMILGGGIDPFAFSLPDSKLIFTLEPVIDLTDAKTAKDVHHIDVEVRIVPTLQELLDYYNTGDEVGLETRLIEHDPFFKKVLETD